MGTLCELHVTNTGVTILTISLAVWVALAHSCCCIQLQVDRNVDVRSITLKQCQQLAVL